MNEPNSEPSSKRTARKPKPVDTDKLPPHSIEAEVGVLGCMMLSPKDCIPYAVDKFRKFGSEVFFDLKHQLIFEAVVDLFRKTERTGTVVDVIALHSYLKDKQQIEAVGGLDFVAALPDQVPTSTNLKYYAGIILDKYYLRRLVRGCTGVIEKVFSSEEDDVDKIIDQAEVDILRVGSDRWSLDDVSMDAQVHKAIQRMDNIVLRQGECVGLPTGFRQLDDLMWGFEEGDYVVLGARTSVGKTALALNMLDNIAIERRIPSAIFSFEMQAPSLIIRLACMRSGVNFRDLRNEHLSAEAVTKLRPQLDVIRDAPITIIDEPMTMERLEARARRLVHDKGIRFFELDYFQLLKMQKRPREMNRVQELTAISERFMEMKKSLGVPWCILSQLGREYDKESGRRKPRPSDIRDCGAVEQDADKILLLYKKSKANEEDAADDDAGAEDIADDGSTRIGVIVAKHRNGPTGEKSLKFYKQTGLFSTPPLIRRAAPETQSEIPPPVEQPEHQSEQRAFYPD